MITVDRRAEYYARAATVIAADPLHFYTRAEAGRKFQARFQTPRVAPIAQPNVLQLRRRS